MNSRTMALIIGFAAFTAVFSADWDTVPNAAPGSESDISGDFLKMGHLRILNNDWGSAERNCNSHYKIFINGDESFGWEFNRGGCGGGGSQPDYPEVELGVHPFGIDSGEGGLLDVSSSDLLPIQIKDIQTASATLENLRIEMSSAGSWNINFEMWLSEMHPVSGSAITPYAEFMTFWGWQDGRWACNVSGAGLSTGDKTYTLCHQSDNWGGWRYYQFRADDGPRRDFNGTIDIKAMLDWLVNNAGFSRDLWVDRFEIGSEIDDNTSGTVTMDNLTFEINGEHRSPEFYDPTSGGWRSVKGKNRKSVFFPAHARVEAVDLRGTMTILETGGRPMTGVEMGKDLPPGIYIMTAGQKEGAAPTPPIVVPVIRR